MSGGSMAGASILLVEDSDTQALQLRRMLERQGFAVTRAATAEAALDGLNEGLPDLVIADYHLPGINGDEFSRRIRMNLRTRAIPVLMLTNAREQDLERQGLESGADAYVSKAAGQEVILLRLRALLRRRPRGAEEAPPPAGSQAQPAFRRAAILLDVGRLAAGTFQLDTAPADLAQVVRTVVGTFQAQADYARVALTVSAPCTLPGEVDRLALSQVVENLVSNALKYGDGKPVHISLERRGGGVVLTVQDNGIGISRTDLNRIFAPFERAVTRRQQPGFGLGLWIVGRLVEAMDGTITCNSAPGLGATFIVTFPIP